MNKQTETPLQSTKRLFFALWPDDRVVQHITQQALPLFNQCQGRLLHAHNWHITLAYFGMADPETRLCLEQQADGIIARPFSLELQQLGFWPRPKVAWLAAKDIPEPLTQLAHDLQLALVPCGYTPESRKYQPHVTLVRKAKRAPAAAELKPIKMEVGQFCLVESQTTEHGADYTVLKRWDFCRSDL